MSLTHQRLFSSIPKEEIQNYCVFDYQKLWTEKDMGRLFNTPQDYKKIVRQIKDVEKDLTQKEKELERLLKTKKDLQKKGKRLDDKKHKRLKQLQKETSILRETLKYLKAQLALLDPYEYVKFNSLPSIEV
jgi:vacuolar-type H+-ATPase subunit I/STV1